MEKLSAVPVRFIKGIGPKKAKVFHAMGIDSIEDLLYYLPRRYEDRSIFAKIGELEEGNLSTIKGQVLSMGDKQSWRRRRFNILEVVLGDESGKISCVWFNQGYLREYFLPGVSVIAYGRIERYAGKLQMSSPEFEIVTNKNEEALNVGRIVPLYSLPQGTTQRHFRHLVKGVLEKFLPKLQEFLPYDIRARNKLENLPASLRNIHFPENMGLRARAYERLAFEEFFLFQLPLALRKIKKKEKKGVAFKVESSLAKELIAGLPFELTFAQKKALKEITQDMEQPAPMQRLLQGDVGSGKTIVATIACLIAVENGFQAAFMAPTEILAKQHYEKIMSQASGLKAKVRMALLTGSLREQEKTKALRDIKEGKVDLVIGTHALLQGKACFKKLGFVVIDEQHKFGVGQRALLPQKGINPDILIMTATPIPRTLAITIYGDLDISVIHELPPGRLPITTMLFSEERVKEAYALAREQLRAGNQVYVIYPVIEESFALDIAGAEKMFSYLKKEVFREFKVGLIHGRMKQPLQDEAMEHFKNGQLSILVATSVLEVGIDIPQATCMLIEQAERFGLSQLHQLRGRVGRGTQASLCLLVADAKTEEAKSRLNAMVNFHDGFRIAEEDLRIRGPGEFFGSLQHGLTELKIANPLTQMQLLKKAREEAIRLVNFDPHLQERQNNELKEKLLRKFPEYEKLVVVG